MKRSEMLLEIEEALQPCNSTYKTSRVKTAKRLLDLIEDLGMLAPAYHLEIFDVMDYGWENEEE